MQTPILNPLPAEWPALCQRPQLPVQNLEDTVRQIFSEIQRNGDIAVKKYTYFFDNAQLENLRVPEAIVENSSTLISEALKNAMLLAKNSIEKFHSSQKETVRYIETNPGVTCWRASRAIDKVGIYIPGGTAPLFSTVLMLGIPAKLAGCRDIILCTPPDAQGNINPAILYAAQLVGINTIYSIGGIQAIGAMTFGTESVLKVDKIFGPGNQFVTAAKQAALHYGVAIDLPAGPSELLVIADTTANPEFVAADLLSQAEHGADSQVMLLSDNEEMIRAILKAITVQLKTLPRKGIIEKALASSKAIVLPTISECIAFSNSYAPEHLIIASENPEPYTDKITNAGSVFLGNYSCESAGDYASGTNHTLPTNGYARNYSGVSLDSFVKKITFQQLTADGIRTIGPAIATMAEAEQLDAHKNAVVLRLKNATNV
ncbi:histidinol dehydrogenase [Flavobacterium kingsejongi]|uniref:Histidinol dehydrogenase n=1 Tax=Flavobacterium kingsejongi TaxID=1678728 RepID=A0A2S1LTN7_9FLAO|nr:histidinol dehydrogenase [Flavobacterium kingsejongi]AWG27068.1 histidinol dehydrogenase [Flavobacterium kingsejongi]